MSFFPHVASDGLLIISSSEKQSSEDYLLLCVTLEKVSYVHV